MRQQIQWSSDVDKRWQEFVNRTTDPRKKEALAFFLGTDEPDEQLQLIKSEIAATYDASLKAVRVIDSHLSRLPKMEKMGYRDQYRRPHMRYSYFDPFLKGRKRFFAELMIVRAKDPVRCAEKLTTDRTWEDQGGNYEDWLKDEQGQPLFWWQRMDDLAAFRIICNLLIDVRKVEEQVEVALGKDCKVEPKDFIWNIDRARKRGARSLHLIITNKRLDKRRFELQVMTTLQLAWDQSEHVIEYEVKRKKEEQQKEKQVDHHTALFRSLSDLLYIADETFDRIYDDQKKLHQSN